MNRHGIELTPAACPLDNGFLPLAQFNRAFLEGADRPVSVALERENGLVSVYDTRLRSGETSRDANLFYLRRLTKCLLWIRGGFRVSVCGDDALTAELRRDYAPGGERAFDAAFMAGVYGRPFEVRAVSRGDLPAARENARRVGRNQTGGRVGLDVGGSNLKYAAAQDGKIVSAGEFPWQPLEHADPAYHEAQIVRALRLAAERLPRVDAVGISSAGILIGGRERVASVFRSIPQELFESKVTDLFQRAAKQAFGNVPVEVANDGDVAALAGSMSLRKNTLLGISMGTSQAGGYVDAGGNLTGWLNELAFVPIDIQPGAAADPWSGDVGCGVEYLAQDSALRLADRAGLPLSKTLAKSQKIRALQQLAEQDTPGARRVFETIGCYLAHALPLYASFYDLSNVLLYGGVTRGVGGSVLLHAATETLSRCYPALAARVAVALPPDNDRRAGQSLAAATL